MILRLLPYLDVDDRIDGVALTFIDITSRKEAEERLVRSEKKFRSVFEQAADAMFLYALEDGEAGEFIDFNEAAVDHVDLSREELYDMTIGEISGGPDGSTSTAPRSSSRSPALSPTANAERVWVEDRTSSIFVLTSDIT